MSLLDNPPHVVVVTPQVRTLNGYGDWDLTAGAPVTVGCSVQPLTVAELISSGGTLFHTDRRVIGRGPWPGGLHSVIRWDGRDWEQVGEAQSYSMSRRTAHFDAVIRARAAEVK